MANRSDRGREQPAALSRASKPAKQNGSSSAETIRASGHDRANRPYTRLHPDKARQTFTDPLATREPSTQDRRFAATSRRVGFAPAAAIQPARAASLYRTFAEPAPPALTSPIHQGCWFRTAWA